MTGADIGNVGYVRGTWGGFGSGSGVWGASAGSGSCGIAGGSVKEVVEKMSEVFNLRKGILCWHRV